MKPNIYSAIAEQVAKQTKTTRIIRFFPDTNLNNGHPGLSRIAKEHAINTMALQPGEFIIFSNRKMTGLKIFTPGNCIAYVKSPTNQRLELRTIQLIPRFFNGTEFNYTGALKEVILKQMEKAA